MQAPFALAFTAGLVASVNPCGFAMLPAYLSFLIGKNDQRRGPAAVARALRVGLTVSAGFLVVFGAAGLALTAGARSVTTAIPWAALVVGVGLIVVGLVMLAGRSMHVQGPARHTTKLAGGLLMVAGGYIVFYWATVLVPQSGGRPGGALLAGVEKVSSRLTTAIGTRPLLSGILLAGTVAAAAWYAWRDRRQGEEGGQTGRSPDGCPMNARPENSDEAAGTPSDPRRNRPEARPRALRRRVRR